MTASTVISQTAPSEKDDKNDISALLDITTGSAVSVVGCGGKTSLIELLATQNIDKKVLVSPATKIFPITSPGVILCDTLQNCIEHVPQIGVQYLGIYNTRNKKLEALPEQVLADMIQQYDITLTEADGSRCLPCKGWRDTEPVIRSFSTHTVGIVTMNALGKPATKKIVHHLPEFLTLTGLGEGDIITEQILIDMVCLPGGMFKNCVGQQYLVVNQVEDKMTTYNAESFIEKIKLQNSERFKKLIYGSVHKNDWHWI